MKYYSDVTNKFYEKEEDLHKAEDNVLAEKKQTSLDKKNLSKKIEETENALALAYEDYDKAKAEVKKILEESNIKCQKILQEANDKITKAKLTNTKAVREFTDKYGTYTVTYTGKKAQEEWERHLKYFDKVFRDFWLF